MGKWMKVNGEAVYGSKASPWGLFEWGRCTTKETKDGTSLYFSVFNWPSDGKITIPAFKNKIASAKLVATGTKVKTAVTGTDLVITLPPKAPDPIASVIRVDVRGKVENILISGQK